MSINLLPWREMKRQHERKQCLREGLSSFAAAIILIILIVSCINTVLDNQDLANRKLRKAYAKTEQQLLMTSKAKQQQLSLQEQVDALEAIKSSRLKVVDYLEQILAVLPPAITLTKLERKDKQLEITGQVGRSSELFLWMKTIQGFPEIKETNLQRIEGSVFQLLVGFAGWC